MSIKKLCEHLNSFLSALDSEYNVNNGGCAFVAYCIARNLERLNLNYKVIFYDGYYENSASYNLSKGEAVDHVFVVIRNYGINSAGYKIKKPFITKCSSYNLYKYYKRGEWNMDYERKYNSIVSRKINKFFNLNY